MKEMQADLHTLLKTEMTRTVSHNFGQVMGHEDVKSVLENSIDQLSRRHLSAPLLLCGHPGVGKSLLLEAAAFKLKLNLFVFNLYCLGSTTYGGATKIDRCINTVFKVASSYGPSILCFEDVEVLSKEEDIFRMGRVEILKYLDSKSEGKMVKDNVLVVGVTTKPWNLDTEIVWLFKIVNIDLPTLQDRILLINKYIDGLNLRHDLDDGDIVNIGHRTAGYTGADLLVFLRQVCMQELQLITKAQFFKKVFIEEQTNNKKTENNEPDVSTSEAKLLQHSCTNKNHHQHMELPNTRDNDCQVIGNEKCNSSVSMIEKYVPCESHEEGAVQTTFLDLPDDKLWQEFHLTRKTLDETLFLPSITEDLKKQMAIFYEKFHCSL